MPLVPFAHPMRWRPPARPPLTSSTGDPQPTNADSDPIPFVPDWFYLALAAYAIVVLIVFMIVL
jgi:hypothetical protein